MNRHGVRVVGILALIGGLVACGSIQEGPAQGRSSAAFQPNLDTVYFADRDIAAEGTRGYSKVAVERTGARPTATGNLEAWALLRNRTNHPLNLEYQASFFDQAEAPIEQPCAWQRVSLGAQSTASISAFSMNPVGVVEHYVIQIRGAR